MLRKCKQDECVIHPTFGYQGQRPLFCSSHRLEGMLDVISKICQNDGCNKNAAYGYEKGQRKYCATHRLEGMLDVKNKRCRSDQCNKQPVYGFEMGKPEYCAIHHLEGMLDVKNKRCRSDQCNKQPVYGFEIGKPEYCAIHHLEGMLDVKNKRCSSEHCNKHPSYGFEIGKPEYCAIHRLDGMVDVRNKMCSGDECNKRASYGFEMGKPEYCVTHHLVGMFDVVSKRCVHDGCDTIVSTRKYKGYCLHCFMHLFPLEKISRNYKIKENEVTSFIITQFSSTTVIQDRRIQDGCSSRRPDVLIDLGYQVIIIEVDENQHTEYDCSCENKRLMQLSRDVNHRPLVFIRFNPDDYIHNGVNVTSCFTQNKLGYVVIKKSKQSEWEHRLRVLRDTIQYWMDHVTEKTVEVVHLFYSVIS